MDKTSTILLNIMLVLAVVGLLTAIAGNVSSIKAEAEKIEPDETHQPNIQRVDLDKVSCFVLEKYRGISCVVTP